MFFKINSIKINQTIHLGQYLFSTIFIKGRGDLCRLEVKNNSRASGSYIALSHGKKGSKKEFVAHLRHFFRNHSTYTIKYNNMISTFSRSNIGARQIIDINIVLDKNNSYCFAILNNAHLVS